MKKSKRLLSILLMLTMLVSMFTVMASAADPCSHENKEFYAAKDATCKTKGNIQYYLCKDCGKKFLNEAMTDEVPFGAVTISCNPSNHENWQQFEEKEPTCKKDGNKAYSHCSACDKYYDAAGNETTREAVTLKANDKAHNLVKVNGKDATCAHEGCWEHQQCSECGKLFDKMGDSFPGTFVIKKDPTNHEDLQPVAAKAATCTNDGNEAYSYCSACGKYYDADGKQTTLDAVTMKATGHTMKPHPAIPADCTKNGIKEYWQCEKCGNKYSDEQGSKEITNVVDPQRPHDMEKIPAKAATTEAPGNIEYYKCKTCRKCFKDGQGITSIEEKDTVIPQLKEEKYTLTIAVEKVNGAVPGEVQYAGKPYEMLEGLQKGETRELTAVAKSGYQFKEWKINDASVSDSKKATTTVTMDDTDATITAVFEKTATPARYKLEIDRNNTKGSIEYRTWFGNKWSRWYTIEKNEYPLAIQGLQKGDKIQIKAYPDSGCVATWMIDRVIETVKDNTYTVTIDDADVSVYVMFQKKISSDRELDLDISGWKHGEIKYRVNNGTKYTLKSSDYPFTLEEGDKITFYIDADSGYTAKWNLDKESKSYSDEFTVRYKDIDEDGSTLHISFVKKSTIVDNDYPTLTFDITGGKHGTVYRGTREYEDGDVISIKKNDKMTFKAKADKGYVAVWTYKGESYVGDEFTVKMGSKDAKLYVEFMDKDDIRLTELPFRDVSKRDWYYDDVVYVYRKGYMDGMSSTRFGGELNTTRGQIVTILWRLTGEPRATKRNPFTDVSSSQYYYDAISWAYDAGVVDGFDAYTFKPDQNVTREQLAAILYRYAKYMNLSTSGSAYLAKYRDADKIANWAYDAMAWANYRGLINGTSATRIDPKGYATRAQIAAILHRFAVEYGA